VIEVPQAWAEAVSRIGAASWRRLAVLGERDQGKSTFCRVLLERLTPDGAGAWLLDADVGQKMIGPPACVTLAEAQASGALALRRIRFVGETNPALAMPATVAAAARLSRLDGAALEARLVVNTSGLVAGPGRALKRWTLDALDPELIVSVGESEALDAVLAAQAPDRVIRLAPSPAARRKSDRAREASRLAAFCEVLRGAAWREVGDAVVEDLHRAPPPAGLRLCGVADPDGEDLTLGLFDPRARRVMSAAEPARVHRLRLGMAAPDALLRALKSFPFQGKDTRSNGTAPPRCRVCGRVVRTPSH
jgi:polynucleotide 5'-hydroxyl-kinase GRC3/NOL9